MEIKYDIISSSELHFLIYHVNNRLKDGWLLQGGISVSNGKYCQAMTKQIPIDGGR